MDFIINHSGFFLGIGITMLLALIGYYADKKDSSKKKSNDNSSKSTTLDELPSVNTNVDSNVIDESFPQNGKFINFIDFDSNVVSDVDKSLDSVQSGVSNVDGFSTNVQNDSLDNVALVTSDSSISDINSQQNVNNVESVDAGVVSDSVSDVNSVNQNVSISFGANDFEDINMSLDDLEKKNYNEIVNNIVMDDSDNYYYSDLEEPAANNSVVTDISSSVSNMTDNIASFQDVDNVNSSSYESINSENSSDVLGSTVDDINDVSHEFDSEVQTLDSTEQMYEASNISDSVPEIFDGEGNTTEQSSGVIDDHSAIDGSVIDPLNDSSSDDIWKF